MTVKVGVDATEVIFRDPTAGTKGSNKFYRVYQVNEFSVFQWGRVGTTGQVKIENWGDPTAARIACDRQIDAKQRKGYGERSWTNFYLDREKFSPDVPRMALQVLDSLWAAAQAQDQVHSDRTRDLPSHRPETTSANGRLENVTSMALAAISFAAADPGAAAVAFVELSKELEELQEQVGRAESYIDTLRILVTQGAS